MTTLITRVYASESSARAAVTALKAKYSADQVALDSKSVKGKTVVTFRAEFGTARNAAKILDAHKPVSGSETTESNGPKGRGSVGLSRFLDLPELFRHNTRTELIDAPTAFSDTFSLPVLSDKKPKVKLLDDPTPLSRMLNIPVLSNKKPDVKLLNWKPDDHLLIRK
ncbi:hypothetical protein M2323_000836 [Rhodoblastus acidophilus]|uniref:hypothetical protein n=1 Tax=Rhodoblastus acidophilus TaxID=1074 RepID=UPI00161EF73D|nr:hypothetical protein [Rhodoblastus acidophilus]MCW2283017.1 hypothetical protein [Rhodoblastus acidophilus]MCW2331932.1 hypothetical protein [Rhodoblastus acidophilus]